MDEDTINDLKQFISTTVSQQLSQQTEELRKEFRGDLSNEISRLEQKIDDLSAAVGDALDNTHQATDDRLNNHEQRITRLEHKAA